MDVIRDHIINLQIKNKSDIGLCRRKSVGLAKQLGFDLVKTGEVAIMVTELVTNVLRHGGGRGSILVCEFQNDKQQKALEVWCCDVGNGIPNVEEAVVDGYTNKTSLGVGLGSIQRFSDEFEINPQKPSFISKLEQESYTHCIRTLKWIPSEKWIGVNSSLDIGATSVPKPGEKLNGDCFVINHVSPTDTIVAVIDGLGHGKYAHEASQLAKEQIIKKANLPISTLLNNIHNAIRGTRGIVIGIARINTEKNKVSYTGIGNIEGYVVTKETKKNLLSLSGIVGHTKRTPRVFDFDFTPGDILYLYSDGITSRWNGEEIARNKTSQKNVEFLLNKYTRQNDDATVLIVQYSS